MVKYEDRLCIQMFCRPQGGIKLRTIEKVCMMFLASQETELEGISFVL